MHEQHSIIETDDNFDTGTLAHLVVGNEGRVLDGRRTPGYIEHYDAESAMFIWRITAFEDAGKCWEIPAEEIGSYQFRKGSAVLSAVEVQEISEQCDKFRQTLTISKSHDARQETEDAIKAQEVLAHQWIKNSSAFFKQEKQLDFSVNEGESLLYADLERYLKALGLYELEQTTAEQYLLNPYSGEWIKGMKIVMAEMGLIAYRGTIPRKKEMFLGYGTKERRRNYIIARIAFLRSVFKLCGIIEVPLFRGMSSEAPFYTTPQTLVSTTFSLNTALDFADMKAESKSRSAYVVKYTCPIENLFMTYLETKQFNERYKEQEAIVFYDGQIQF